MPVYIKYSLCCLVLLTGMSMAGAQTLAVPGDSTTGVSATRIDSGFSIRNIVISGNKKTRPNIILRELPFHPGDQITLPDLVRKFEEARRNLLNTTLFHEVIVALKGFDGYQVDVMVSVKERWYLFPLPYFKLVDRNLNQWLVEQHGSLDRVNYGAKLLYYNTTGRNDKLRIYFITGYTRQFSIGYDRLYIDHRMKWGLNTHFSTGRNKELNYVTVNDKQVFFNSNQFLRTFTNGSVELSYRKAIKTRHRFGFAYTTERISDTIQKLNPSYFPANRARIAYPELYYTMTYNGFDYYPYPTKGYGAELSFDKKGFNDPIDLWQFSARGGAVWPTGPRTFLSLMAYGNLKLPFHQPYYNQRLLGYNDAFLQGYEYYVIDGVAAGYLKATFARRMVKFDIRTPGIRKFAPQKIPFTIYAKIYGNTGYVHNPVPGENSLTNRMLYSGGIGLDIFTFYDFTIKLEWSFNQLGQNDLFLQTRKSFF